MPEGRAKTSPSPGKSAVRNGVLTGLGTVLSSAAAAGAAVLIAHAFGKTAQTDGFFTAYGAYLVLGLAAQSFRVVVLPELTRASADGRLGAETRAYLGAFALLAVPLVVLVAVFSGSLGDAITGTAGAAHEAARALPWLAVAAAFQIFASLLSSALAVRGSYGTAGLGYGGGAVVGLAVFAALESSYGLVSLAWGVALNGGFTVVLTGTRLVRLGGLGSGSVRLDVRRRLGLLVHGAAVPVSLQAMYVVALSLAAALGVGSQTTLSYAYVLAATLVAATASALSLISSAPLTRRGLDAESAAAHVVHASWLSLAGIAAAAGVFALVGGRIVGAVLGSAYSGSAGRELGRLVVYLAPWMVVTVAFTVAYPLLFVVGRGRVLVPLALGALAADVPLTWALREAGGLNGIVLALAAATALVLVVVLAALSRRMLELASLGIGRVALVIGGLAALCFGLPPVVLAAAPAAAVGLVLYAGILVVAPPRGLREAWAYVRVLH